MAWLRQGIFLLVVIIVSGIALIGCVLCEPVWQEFKLVGFCRRFTWKWGIGRGTYRGTDSRSTYPRKSCFLTEAIDILSRSHAAYRGAGCSDWLCRERE